MTSAVSIDAATAASTAAEAAADSFFARFLFLNVCVSAVLLRGDTVVCVVLLYLDDSVCIPTSTRYLLAESSLSAMAALRWRCDGRGAILATSPLVTAAKRRLS